MGREKESNEGALTKGNKKYTGIYSLNHDVFADFFAQGFEYLPLSQLAGELLRKNVKNSYLFSNSYYIKFSV